MIASDRLREIIESGGFDRIFSILYPRQTPEMCRARYIQAVQAFEATFGMREVLLVSAPGRTEIGGNHTDHQRGRVLAAAVDLDILCVAARREDTAVHLHSLGFSPDEVDLKDLSPQPGEEGTSAGLIRGIAAWMREQGRTIGGFDACTTSEVLGGSGLSSSAAFEVAVGTLFDRLWEGNATPQEIAIAGKYAENRYFGKPSGLMDQMASAVGGVVAMDFADPDAPVIRPVPFSLEDSAYRLCIVDTRGSHAGMTDAYASIPEEMGRVAAHFGKKYLREVDPTDFYGGIAAVRAAAGDRAVLRAIHFFGENERVPHMAEALATGDLPAFLGHVLSSGRSSFCYLQNVFHPARPQQQELSLALARSETLLEGEGAWRVHGGGFAGTIQAFVPRERLDHYCDGMNALFGEGACHVLSIRPRGGIEVLPE